MRFVLKQNSNINLSTRASVYLTMFMRKFKNLPLQDFPGEPLRWSAFGAFPFQIFEPPRCRAKAQAAEKPLALSSPYPQKIEYFRISFHFFNTILDRINSPFGLKWSLLAVYGFTG